MLIFEDEDEEVVMIVLVLNDVVFFFFGVMYEIGILVFVLMLKYEIMEVFICCLFLEFFEFRLYVVVDVKIVLLWEFICVVDVDGVSVRVVVIKKKIFGEYVF